MIYSMALTLILGLGTCSQDGDWCHTPTGKIAAEQELISAGKHGVVLSAEHFSRAGDGELRGRGDRGIEVFTIEYRYKIGE